MLKLLTLISAILLQPALAIAASCPVMLVSSTRDSNAISINFRNMGKVPIRRIEFACRTAVRHGVKPQTFRCAEENASFLPYNEYTVSYAIPRDARGPILVSWQSMLLAGGQTVKPTKNGGCRTLTARPEKTR